LAICHSTIRGERDLIFTLKWNVNDSTLLRVGKSLQVNISEYKQICPDERKKGDGVLSLLLSRPLLFKHALSSEKPTLQA
jgi:hypothetical protein